MLYRIARLLILAVALFILMPIVKAQEISSTVVPAETQSAEVLITRAISE
jgi:hypothetical protein